MAAPLPLPQIGYIVNGIEVQFTSLSLNVTDTTTYAWDFGDGGASSDENPIHKYNSLAFFSVTLTVTNDEAVTQTIQINLSGALNPNIFNNISALVDLFSPTGILGTITNYGQKDFFIAKWQLYLQPLVFNPEVTLDNVHVPSSWPPLVNALIAKLVVIDIIEANSAAFLLNSSSEGSSASSTTTTTSGTTSSSQGGIKSIETGPTKVERYENKDTSSNSEKIANIAKAYQNLLSQGGILDQMKAGACQESAMLQIYLPMCAPLLAGNKGFSVINSKRNKYCC